MKKLIVFGLLGGLSACSNVDNHSSSSGHYEQMTKDEAMALVAQLDPVAIAEHDLTDRVILSAELVMTPYTDQQGYERGLDRADIAKAIFDTDTNLTIVTDKGIDPTVDDKFTGLRELMGDDFDQISFVETNTLVPTIWARDWGPIQALDKDGNPLLLDFNYYPTRPDGDMVPSLVQAGSVSQPRLSVPVYNEGGNFMTNKRSECIMTSRVSDANQKPEVFYLADNNLDPIVDEQGNFVIAPMDNNGRRGTLYYNNAYQVKIRVDDEYLNDEQIADYYKQFAGCEEVVILPRMPYEGTGHIDMWAKYLSDDEILINDISDEQINSISDAQTIEAAKVIQNYLRDRQKDLATLGYKLSKIPMPLPQLESIEWQGELYENFVIRSYTNSLIIQKENGEQTVKTALIPQYKLFDSYVVEDDQLYKAQLPYNDDSLLGSYESKVLATYEAAGYQTKMLLADDIIAQGGAIHCVTMQTHKN